MSTRSAPPHSDGFTLIELLIAVTILALLSILGYRAVASLADTEVRLSAEAEQWRTLDRLFSRMEGDFRTAIPREVRLGDSREPAWVGLIDQNGNSVLRISRAGPEFALEPGSAGQRIAYRVRSGALEVLYWAAFDVPGDATPQAYALASNVSALRIAYLDSQGAWRDRWPVTGEAALPRGVQVQLQLVSGERIERWTALQ
ncbi:MAG: type II secretion system minor pseudopilin GspJ [Pseudomonadota bacterium]|nr:type II secretion system minor pseudopilin GspJ [Pseudomonadota bacterium]